MQQMFQRAGAGLGRCRGGRRGRGERCGNLDSGRLSTGGSLCAETLQPASHPFAGLKMHIAACRVCVYLPGVSAPPSPPTSPLWARDLSIRVTTVSAALSRRPGTRDLPNGSAGKESACQCRRHRKCGFDPWVRKIS